MAKKTFQETLDFISEKNNWKICDFQNDLLDMVDYFESLHLIKIHRPLSCRIKPINIKLSVMSIISLDWARPFSKRYSPKYCNLIKSCFRANRLGLSVSFLLSMFILFTLISQGILSAEIQEKYVYAVTPILLYVSFVLHIICHEFGHLFMMNRLNGESPKFISVRGLRVTISYEKASSIRILQRVVAASGPVFGIVGAQIIALTIFILPPISLAWWIVSFSGFLHLYSFLPWTVDGKIIWRKSL